jgi:adenylate cyclase
MRLSVRNKLIAVCFSTAVFTGLALVVVIAIGGMVERAAITALGTGLAISLFEEFYVQGRPGRWLRAMHPAVSIALYSLIIVVFAMTVMTTHMMASGGPHGAAMAGGMRRGMPSFPSLLVVLPLLLGVAVTAIMTLRIVGYLGGRNLFYLMIGKYHRPVLEQRIFLFLDIKNSTARVEQLGPIKARALIGKFFFDISGPITDLGGEIYRFTGDGVVAVWGWQQGVARNRIVRAIDAIDDAVSGEAKYYRNRFGHVPDYRIGVHGGPIVTCEEGDTKRAIGFYGDTIHVAARLEQKARELQVDCVLSGDIAELQTGLGDRLRVIGEEPVRGIAEPIRIFELLRARHGRLTATATPSKVPGP